MIRSHRLARVLAVTAGATLMLGLMAGLAAAEDIGSQNSGGLTYITTVPPAQTVPPVVRIDPCVRKPWLCAPSTIPPITVPPVTVPPTTPPTTQNPPTVATTPTTGNAYAGSSGAGLVPMPEAPHVVVHASPNFTG